MSKIRLHGERPPRGQRRVPQSPLFEGRFGRLFRKLRPCEHYSEPELKELADAMREPEPTQPGGGWSGPGAAPDELDNPEIPAAYTYFGQFIDHDITFDPVSSLQAKNDPDALVDFRSPRFDLDSVYGSGRDDEPFQYDQLSGGLKLLLEANDDDETDLPRNSQSIALIGDPRNDENLIVSQLQTVFLRFHNKVVDHLRSEGFDETRLFEEARRVVRWHYQWVVVTDYLRRIIGEEAFQQRVAVPDQGAPELTTELYKPKRAAFMPVEFSAAAFRFGHSQVRQAYSLTEGGTVRPVFVEGGGADFVDLRGRRRLPQGGAVDWKHFISIDGSVPQPSRKIDAKLVPSLFSLPGSEKSLALRNLLRGEALRLPRGQAVAKFLGLTPLTGEQLGTALDPTPLWFYILKESELGGGRHLGPVGATIVAEVLLGLLQMDPNSWVNVDPSWRPTLPSAGERFELADLIRFPSS